MLGETKKNIECINVELPTVTWFMMEDQRTASITWYAYDGSRGSGGRGNVLAKRIPVQLEE